MHLTKKEMKKAREDFLAVEKASRKLKKPSLLEFIRWMDQFQKTFGPFKISREKIKGDNFLL